MEVLACPECFNPLVVEEDGGEVGGGVSSLRCSGDGIIYPVQNGIPLLVRERGREDIEAFETSYSAAWAKDGWGTPKEEYVRALPYRDTTGRQSGKWRVKARSMEALIPALADLRLTRIVDLGAGVGWLSHHLAVRGYEVFAVDALRNDMLGLGSARSLVDDGPWFERIWGDLERPPFLPGTMDAVVCNASIHYATNLEDAVSQIAQTVRGGGVLAILNSPVYRDPSSAQRAEQAFHRRLRSLGADEHVISRYRHLTWRVLTQAVESSFGSVQEISFDPGLWFRTSRRVKSWVLGMELASFPLLIARREA